MKFKIVTIENLIKNSAQKRHLIKNSAFERHLIKNSAHERHLENSFTLKIRII